MKGEPKKETIIENGKKMEGIPYPVAVWDAKKCVYASDMDEEEQAREIEYYSNDGNYIIDNNRHELHLYVFEIYADKYTGGEIELYTDKDEAVEAAKRAWYRLHESERRTYRRDKCGTFRVYEVSIPYTDLIGEGEEAYTEDPYTEYEEWEWYNALKED